MPNTRLSSLSSGGAIATGDLFYAVETAGVGGVQKTGAQLLEFIVDSAAGAIVGGSNISATYDDGAGTITIAYTGATPPATTDDLPEGTTNLYAGRETLTANRTYYVRTATGSDSNDGLTVGNAFATRQKALDVVGMLDRSVYDVLIDTLGNESVTDDGSTGALIIKAGPGAGTITLDGDVAGGTTTASVLTQTNNGGFTRGLIVARGVPAATTVIIKNFGIKPGSGASNVRALMSRGGSLVEIDNLAFSNPDSATSFVHLSALQGGIISVPNGMGDMAISGPFSRHYETNGGIINDASGAGTTTTLTGTPAISGDFAFATNLGQVFVNRTFSGAATGSRFEVTNNSLINVNGAGSTYFPGDVAGVVVTGVYN